MPSQTRKDATPRGPTLQRRLLSILFCDLVGSTELSAGLDPEDLLDVMTRYHRCCADVIEGAGGFVGRMLGDAVVAYFGYPRTQEDDAIQAVRGALDLFDAVAAVDTGVERKLEIRVGIATGTVIVGDLFGKMFGEQDVVGETANLAARLQTAADPGQVFICSTTHDLARGHFRYRRLDPMTLKGFADPVSVWQVLGAAPVASRFAAQRSRALTPLVGRKAEVDRLWRSWREACAQEGRVVLLTGEPGIGKSRLTEELIERLDSEPYARLRFFCSPYHSSSALFPFINQLERAAGFERGEPAERKLEKLETLLARSAAETEHRVAVLADLLSLPTEGRYSLPVESPRERRERVFVVLLEQLVGLAARDPVLVILEDLHWIDPTSQELLSRLVELAPQSRVLVLLTARPEYLPPWRERPHIRTIPLWGLNRGETALLIEGVAGGRTLPPEVVEPILGRTEGVPLFVEELTKTVIESGLLRADAERYVLVGPLPPLAIPTSLEASLLARLDRLAPVMEVAQAGAALGRHFSYAVIRSVSSQPDAALRGALSQLVDAQIIQQRGTPPDAEYTFNHALLQDVAYGMMMRGKRQTLHAQIVQALESDFPDTAELEPEVVALHCSGADLIDKAVGYWLKAGARAVTRSANREAIDHLTKGIALLPRMADSPERARSELTMQLTLGHASIAVNGYCNEVTSRAYGRAGELIEFGDLDQRIGILFGMYFGHLMGGKLERGIAPLQKLLALAQESGNTGYICLAHRVRGVLALYRGELAAARTDLEKAVEIYDHEQHSALTFRFGSHVGISAKAWLSVTLWLLGLPDTARRLADETVAAARHFGHAHTLGHVLGLVTHIYADSEDFTTLVAISAEGAEFCERHRLGFFGPWLRFMHIWAGAHAGDPAESIAAMRDALASYEATNTTLMRAYFRGILVRSLLIAGRLDEAAAEVEVALRDIAETREYWWRPEILRLRAECLMVLPQADGDAAESCLRQAVAEAHAAGSKMLELRAAAGLARLLLAEGRPGDARALLTPILAGFTEGFATPDLVAARELLAERPAAE
jgi:class 3 adenylate cyclase/predicted ATPase